MIKQTDIIKAVLNKIISFDPDAVVYTEDTTEGYTRPCYFIQVLPISRGQSMGEIYDVKMLVAISYFSDTSDIYNNYELLDNLVLHFSGFLSILDRNLTVFDLTIDSLGNDNREFNLTFSLVFKDILAHNEDTGVLAKEVITKINDIKEG